MKIAISSGHGKYIRGASGSPVPPQLDEVDEARRVVEHVADYLADAGVEVETFHDNSSHDQSTNLDTICEWHNDEAFKGGDHDYDISVHFNAYDGNAHGTEVLYTSTKGGELAADLSAAISVAGGFSNRGAKERSDLAFLNNTAEVACLIETCFCDNTGDSQLFRARFDDVCRSIAETLAGRAIAERPPLPEPPEEIEPPEDALFYAKGRCSTFGGPDDEDPDSELAFFYEYADAPSLFLIDYDPEDLFHSLNPAVYYFACRFDYSITPKAMLRDTNIKALVSANGREWLAHPADWGPHEEETGRDVDLSPGLAAALQVSTDDIVTVIYPAPAA